MQKLPKLFIFLTLLFSMLYAGDLSFDVYRRAAERSDFASQLSDQQIRDIVTDLLNIDQDAGLYSVIDVHVWDGYYVVILFSSTTYQGYTYRIDPRRDGTYAIIEDYPGDEGLEEFCAECPSDTAQILLTACFSSSSHISRRKVKEAYEFLVNKGYRGVVHLAGQSQATPQNVLNFLACKNLKLWGRIGHGTRTAINFAGSRGGNITNRQLGEVDLTNKFLIINSCYVHNSQFTPYVVNKDKGNGFFFCGGDNVVLGMHSSEYAFYDIVTKGITEPETEFGALVKKESQEHCSASQQYGFTRNAAANGSCTWNDISKKELTVSYPNGSETLKANSSYTIKWNSNAGGNVKIDLLKSGSVVKIITNSTANSGTYSWKVPAAIENDDDYKVKISSVETSSLIDESDQTFTISGGTGILSFQKKVNTYALQYNGSHLVYQIPDNVTDHVTISICTLQGKVIQTLVNGRKTGGYYSIPLQSGAKNSLCAGVYLCRMNAGDFQKMINIVVLQ